MSDDAIIKVLVDDAPAFAPSTALRGLEARPSFEDAVRKAMGATITTMTVDSLTSELVGTYEKVTRAIEALPKESHGCSLQSVSFSLGISSSGEVSLFSAVSGRLEGQTGLTFTVQKGA
jgi:hypothetical protein